MKKDGEGGGSTVTGLRFEEKVNFLTLIQEIPGYSVRPSLSAGADILFGGQKVAACFRKHEFYRFLENRGVRWQDHISKRLLPDDAILVILRETLFIIEVKYQQVAGSVDEKLQTCDFKRKQYGRLVSPLGLTLCTC